MITVVVVLALAFRRVRREMEIGMRRSEHQRSGQGGAVPITIWTMLRMAISNPSVGTSFTSGPAVRV